MDSLNTLDKLSVLLTRESELEVALNQALELLAESLELESGWVWLRNDQGSYYLAASLNLPSELHDPAHMVGRSCYCLEMLESGALRSERVSSIECSRLMGRASHTRYHATLPLQLKDKALGIINLTAPGWRAFQDRDQAWLNIATRQIALAVEREHLAAEKLSSVREQERLALARDIHDQMAQSFTAIALHAEAGQGTDGASQALSRILTLAREGLEQARNSVQTLRQGKPLTVQLRDSVQHFTNRSGIRVDLELSAIPALRPGMEEEILAIVREGLTNVLRHAQARRVSLSLNFEEEILTLRLRDDGVGLHDSKPGYGMRGMKERALLIGGRLRFTDSTEGGTELCLELAL